jgi:restriction endonuclease S subunit
MPKYKFDEIATNITIKKKPVDSDRENYLGLENLDPGTFDVTRFNDNGTPKGDKLIMKKGDVLFGKRRAYQRKVAIAPFDGIFSAHGMVLRPKENVIDKDFFPFFIRSNEFLNKAIEISVGSLSPTIDWRDLKSLEFNLPPIKVQKELARVLWAIEDSVRKYSNVLKSADSLVKSRFVELHGNLKDKEILKNYLLDITKGPFGSDMKKSLYVLKGPNTYKVYTQGNVIERNVHLGDYYISKEYYREKCQRFEVHGGDFLVTCDGTLGKQIQLPNDIEKGVISSSLMKITLSKNMDPVYFHFLWDYEILPLAQSSARNTCLLHLPSATTISNFHLQVLPFEQQKLFANQAKEIDKLKFKRQISNRFQRSCRPFRKLLGLLSCI